MVCNHAPACGAINARSLAWPSGSSHPFHTIVLSWSISGLSQSLCCSGIGSVTVGSESLRDSNISSLYVSIHSLSPRARRWMQQTSNRLKLPASITVYSSESSISDRKRSLHPLSIIQLSVEDFIQTYSSLAVHFIQ